MHMKPLEADDETGSIPVQGGEPSLGPAAPAGSATLNAQRAAEAVRKDWQTKEFCITISKVRAAGSLLVDGHKLIIVGRE